MYCPEDIIQLGERPDQFLLSRQSTGRSEAIVAKPGLFISHTVQGAMLLFDFNLPPSAMVRDFLAKKVISWGPNGLNCSLINSSKFIY